MIDIIKSLEMYMFSNKNMLNYCITNDRNNNKMPLFEREVIKKEEKEVVIKKEEVSIKKEEKEVSIKKDVEVSIKKEEVSIKKEEVSIKKEEVSIKKKEESFTPIHKDKLFWCFYVLLNGFNDYEMNKTGFYAVEKTFKISSVEKLRTMKQEIKNLKLKISEVEDELVNKDKITLKGLQVLCLVYKVSITYIYDKKYCEFLYGNDIKGIISQNCRKDHSLIYDESIEHIKETHWFIENVQKPLKPPASYSLKELQDICTKLCISITNINSKSKLKKELYEDILTKL